jgi:hypothetical protein
MGHVHFLTALFVSFACRGVLKLKSFSDLVGAMPATPQTKKKTERTIVSQCLVVGFATIEFLIFRETDMVLALKNGG